MHMCGYILHRSVRSNHAYVRMFHANEATPGVCALPTNREWLIQRQAARAEAQQLQRRSEEAEAGRWSGGDGANVTGWARVVLQVSFGAGGWKDNLVVGWVLPGVEFFVSWKLLCRLVGTAGG